MFSSVLDSRLLLLVCPVEENHSRPQDNRDNAYRTESQSLELRYHLLEDKRRGNVGNSYQLPLGVWKCNELRMHIAIAERCYEWPSKWVPSAGFGIVRGPSPHRRIHGNC